MPAILFLVILLSLSAELPAATIRLFLGSLGSETARPEIFLSALNTETGALQTPKELAGAENPSFLAISFGGDFLYSVAEKEEGKVFSWSVAPDASLTKLNEQPSGGAGPCHISISPSGRVLFVANYTGGSVAAFPIKKDGSIGEQTAFIQFNGTGPDAKRQEKPHAHGVYCDPGEEFVYVTDLGTDRVWIFKLDAAAGTLTAAEPPFASLPPGSGPRHLAFGKDHVYVNGEMGLGITVLARDGETGALTPGVTTPVFPEGMVLTAKPDTAEVVVHPNGRFLYLSTRGVSSISTFAIDKAGQIAFIENIRAGVEGPRHFTCSPDGKWLVVAGQRDNRVTAFSIDSTSGKLRPTQQVIELPSPVCAIFVPARQ